MSTTEGKSLQDVIQGAIEAEDKGVPVDWKAMCLQTYNVAMEEIKRLQPAPDVPHESMEPTVRGGEPANEGE